MEKRKNCTVGSSCASGERNSKQSHQEAHVLGAVLSPPLLAQLPSPPRAGRSRRSQKQGGMLRIEKEDSPFTRQTQCPALFIISIEL